MTTARNTTEPHGDRVRRGDPVAREERRSRGARARLPRAPLPRTSSRSSRGRAAAASRRDVTGRHGERRRDDEQVAAERRVARGVRTRRDEDDLAGERDRAADQPARPRPTPRDDRGVEAGEDRERGEDHHPVQRRGALLPERVDDREDHESRQRRDRRATCGPADFGKPLSRAGEERHREQARDDGAERCDDERRQVVERKPRHDRRASPDHHHEQRDDDRGRTPRLRIACASDAPASPSATLRRDDAHPRTRASGARLMTKRPPSIRTVRGRHPVPGPPASSPAVDANREIARAARCPLCQLRVNFSTGPGS